MTLKMDKKLVKGSLTLVLMFGLFNFFNFLFQLAMARMLTIPDYGILATLFSIIYILLIFSESVQTIITKYSAEENNKGKLNKLIKKSTKRAFSTSLYFYLIYLAVSIPLSYVLKINYFLLSLNGVVIFLSFFLPITRGVMQGRGRFYSLGSNMIIESSLKLVLGILFVAIGWRIFGAITGVLLGGLITFSLSFIPLKDIMKARERNIKTIGIYDYARPTFFITLIVITFYSLDIIIAKILFTEEITGSYAIVSILSKIIFWGTLPISKVMFPMSAENKDKNSGNIFMNAFIIIFLGIFVSLVLFYFFPEILIKIFSGKEIHVPAITLFILGIAMSFLSISNLVLLYKLSLGNFKGYSFLYLFLAVEIFLLFLFSGNIIAYSMAFVTSASIFLWGSIFLIKS